MDDLNRPGNHPADPLHSTTRPPARSGSSSMYLILGALVVAVAVLAFAFSGNDAAEDGRAGTDAPVTESAPATPGAGATTAPSAAPTAPDASPAAPTGAPPAGAPSTAPAN
jgi:hypothetical protein